MAETESPARGGAWGGSSGVSGPNFDASSEESSVPASGSSSVVSTGVTSASGVASTPGVAPGSAAAGTGTGVVGVTRQMVFDRSSATISAPRGSTVTPTGRPRVMPSSPRKPETKSTGSPAGSPLRSGQDTTP